MIQLKQVYERPEFKDGLTVLVERLWPRGVRKSTPNVDIWLKGIAPSDKLRKWYMHDPRKWKSFKKKYLRELDKNEFMEDILVLVLENDPITFVFGSSNLKQNSAVVLKEYVERKLRGMSRRKGRR